MNRDKTSGESINSSEEVRLQNLYNQKIPLLQKISSHFFSTTSWIIKIGIELEFYLTHLDCSQLFDSEILENFIFELSQKIPADSLIYKIEKEQGAGQIEVKTSFDSNLLKICHEIEWLKSAAKNLARERNLIASFVSQQFPEDCGSALQFNISLHDLEGKNLFESDEMLLQKIAQNLLNATNQMIIFLAPKKEDYARFSYELNRNLFKKGKFTAPVNLSFGADNRTCAIRVPLCSKTQKNNFGKRLEYRIASSDADPFLCLSAILSAILFEKESGAKSLKQIHGNAFDEKYETQKFCQNLEEAQENFFSGKNAKYLFTHFIHDIDWQ